LIVVIQYPIDGWGSAADLAKRHKVEGMLNECLGWTGNGCCDGGDIGSGTMNSFCSVVDPYIACSTIVDALRLEGLAEGVVIALEQDEDFEVLWPHGFTGTFSYM
jgi:hypothetical protein